MLDWTLEVIAELRDAQYRMRQAQAILDEDMERMERNGYRVVASRRFDGMECDG